MFQVSLFFTEFKSLYPWPHAIAHWPMNADYGINNMADGYNKDGVAMYYSTENGPYGKTVRLNSM